MSEATASTPPRRLNWLGLALEILGLAGLGFSLGVIGGVWILDLARVAKGESYTDWSAVITVMLLPSALLPAAVVAFFGARLHKRNRGRRIVPLPYLVALAALAFAAGAAFSYARGFPH